MLIVTGSATARTGCFDDLLALSLEHVRRSRQEPGCISHAVNIDAENPMRLVFIEEWQDRPSLSAHFALPASRAFIKAARQLADGPVIIRIYEANPVEISDI